MRRDYVLFHLREAQDAVAHIIRDMEADSEYSEPELQVDITHLYHHVNTAWNARNAPAERTGACGQDDFDQWRQFPADITFE